MVVFSSKQAHVHHDATITRTAVSRTDGNLGSAVRYRRKSGSMMYTSCNAGVGLNGSEWTARRSVGWFQSLAITAALNHGPAPRLSSPVQPQ